MYFTQVFDSLFPLNKWKNRVANLNPGDIILLGWEAKLGKGKYRLAIVNSVETDYKGLVRTATIKMRPRDSCEKTLPYKSKELIKMTMGIQRLVLICLAENIPDLKKEESMEQ